MNVVDTNAVEPTPAAAENEKNDNEMGPMGCYLVYESSAGGRLMLQYSQGPVPSNAVGFWAPAPDQTIQAFKFKAGGGRSELIRGIAGGEIGRKRYFGGWCQFLKLGKAKGGSVIQFTPDQGVNVDVYAFISKECHPEYLPLEKMTDISQYDAVAVMPQHHSFLKGVKTIAESNFLELGNLAGAATNL